MKRVGLYPGTFDPITLGHVGIIQSATTIFDHVVISIALNLAKQPRYSLEIRQKMIYAVLDEYGLQDKCIVENWGGLTAVNAARWNALAIVRSLRSVSDFESELDMAFVNRALVDIPTIFIAPLQGHLHIRSSTFRLLKSIDAGVDVYRQYVPESIIKYL